MRSGNINTPVPGTISISALRPHLICLDSDPKHSHLCLARRGRARTYTISKEGAAALDAYRRALPVDWKISTVDASGAIVLGGAVHCAALELRLARSER